METAENVEVEVKKLGRGRPPKDGVEAMSVAARKRAQRNQMFKTALDDDFLTWSEAVCLYVLSNGKLDGSFDRRAWKRLGEIRGYL